MDTASLAATASGRKSTLSDEIFLSSYLEQEPCRIEPQTERQIIQDLFELLSQVCFFFSFKIRISSKLIKFGRSEKGTKFQKI